MYRRVKCLKNIHNETSLISCFRNASNLSYIHHLGTEPLFGITIGKYLEKIANKYGDRPAIISKHQNQIITFSEILTKADKFAAGLKRLGLTKFDKLGIWATNSIEFEIVFMACVRIGVICVLLNPAYQENELEYCINKVGIKCIIADHKTMQLNHYDIINNVTTNLSICDPGKLRSQKVPSLETVIILTEKTLKGTYNFNEVLNSSDENGIKKIQKYQADINFDDPCNIQFTSGTTGQSKATVLSHFNLINNGYIFGKRANLHISNHKICVQVPLFHGFGLTCGIICGLACATTQVLPSATFSAEKSLDAIQDEQCTVLYGTPTMYVDLINIQKQRKLDILLDIACVGGAPCSPSLVIDMLQTLKLNTVMAMYGQTEATALVFQTFLTDKNEISLNYVGHVQDHIEVKVVDKNNKLVPFGEAGELCVRGYSIMREYYEDEENTSKVLNKDKWCRTGDKFILYENGYGKIVGRIKEMIIRGGENIFPIEIENFLLTHPDIIDCQIVGLPHERLGEEICACVRVRPGSTLDLKALKEFCGNKIAYFKIPSKLIVFAEFPKTTSGKIQKFKIIEEIMKKIKLE